MVQVSKPLLLKGSRNTRELGGYPINENNKTRSHQFLRSDGLHNLTKNDMDKLYQYGVRCIIDLRSDMEVEREQDPTREGIELVHDPLLDHVQSDGLKGLLPSSMVEMYIGLLDNSQKTIAQVFKKIAQYPEECVLYHCTAGKDRTGVISMLLLAFAGVADDIVIADYAATEGYLGNLFDGQIKMFQEAGIEVPYYVWKSTPDSMKETLAYFYKKYKSAKDYFKLIGLTDTELQILSSKLSK